MKAVVLLRGSPEALRTALGDAPDAVSALEDGLLVTTGLSMRSLEPDQLAAALASRLGDALAAHDDQRGVFVFPSVVQPKAQSYDAVIDEVAEAGEWLPVEAADVGPAGAPDLEALMGGMMQAFGPQLMEMARGMMEQNPDLASQLQGGPMDLGSLAEKAQKLMKDNPNLVDDVARRLGQKDPKDDD